MIKDPKKAWKYVEKMLHQKLIQTKFKERVSDIRITEVNHDLESRRSPWIEYCGKIVVDGSSYNLVVRYSFNDRVSAWFYDKDKRIFIIDKMGYRKYQNYVKRIGNDVGSLSKLYPNIWGVKSLKGIEK